MTTKHFQQLIGADKIPFTMDITLPEKCNGVVVYFFHGFKSFKDWGSYNELANHFADHGYIFVKWNYSHNGVGATQTDDHNFVRPELFALDRITYCLQDFDHVYDFVNSFCLNHSIVVEKDCFIGHSRGGAIAICAAAAHQPKGLITLNAIPEFLYNLSDQQLAAWKDAGYREIINARTGQIFYQNYTFVEDIFDNPLLTSVKQSAQKYSGVPTIIHSEFDETVSVENMNIIYDYFAKAIQIKISNKNYGHTFGMQHPSNGLNEFWMLLPKQVAASVAS